MALTLVEAAKLETGNAQRRAIIELFARSHPVLGALPFEGIEGNSVSFVQEEVLPGVGARGVNQGYSEDSGSVNPITERVSIFGGDLDVDKFIVDTMGVSQRAIREAMKVKNLAHSIGHRIIKGDSDTDPREFDGLQKRIPFGDGQAVDNGDAALSLINLDALIDRVDDPTHIIMNQAMKRRLSAAARAVVGSSEPTAPPVAGNLTYSMGQFGQQVLSYNALPILVADPNDSAFASLPFDEGGGSDETSIYCVSMREGMFTGIENGGIDVRDLGELETEPKFRTRCEWYVGVAQWHARSIGRLHGVLDAAVTP